MIDPSFHIFKEIVAAQTLHKNPLGFAVGFQLGPSANV